MMPGATELALILVIVLILFGAGKLPQVFEAFGTGIKKFREASTDDRATQDVTPAAKQIPGGHGVDEAEVVEKQKAAHD